MLSSASFSNFGSGWPPPEWADDSRMGFYMRICDVDEEERQQKLQYWQSGVIAFLHHQASLPQSSLPSSDSFFPNDLIASPSFNASMAHGLQPGSLSFTLPEVQKGMMRKGEIISAIEPVLCSLLADDEIRPVSTYSSPPPSSGVFGVVSYLWSWVSPRKRTKQRLPPGRYALVSAVDIAAKQLVQKMSSEYESGDVLTLDELAHIAGHSPEDTLLIINHLNREGIVPVAEARPNDTIQPPNSTSAPTTSHSTFDPSTRVFKWHARSATSSDHARCMIHQRIRQLQSMVERIEQSAKDRDKEARRFLLNKQRDLALSQLQRKKKLLTHLTTLNTQLDNLETLQSHIEVAETQQEYFRCMQSANKALRSVQNRVSAEEVTALHEDISEQLSELQLVDESMAAPLSASSSVNVDAEFAALLSEVEAEEPGGTLVSTPSASTAHAHASTLTATVARAKEAAVSTPDSESGSQSVSQQQKVPTQPAAQSSTAVTVTRQPQSSQPKSAMTQQTKNSNTKITQLV